MKLFIVVFIVMLLMVMWVVEVEVENILGGDWFIFIGVECVGNVDGMILEWIGGMIQLFVGYEVGGLCLDLFVDEKLVFIIIVENYQQYDEKLIVGQKVLFEKYFDMFCMLVYLMYWVVVVLEWVYENIKVNVVKVEFMEDGNGVVNVFGGYLFFEFENGLEVIWNYLFCWQGDGLEKMYYNLIVYDNGFIVIGGGIFWEDYFYYDW